MTTTSVTIDDLIAAVRQLAAEHPDNVYHKPLGHGWSTGCSYNNGLCDDGSEGCIFGQAFRRIGVDTSQMTTFIGVELARAFGERPVDEKMTWCAAVQARQDGGATWSSAVASADAKEGHP